MTIWTAPFGLHIRFGQTADAGALAKLHAEGFFRGWPRSDFEAYLADAQVTPAYVASDAKKKVAGFAMLRLAGDESELITIAVDRKLRGKGLGKALLRAALDDLQRTPVRRMFLEVDETNASAIRLYRGFGFADVGTRRGYYPHPDGTTATALVMRADLG